MADVLSRCLAEFEDVFVGPLNMLEMIQRVMDKIRTVNKFKTQIQLNSCNPNSYNSNNHVIRTNFPVTSNFPIMYGNPYNLNNHVIRTNFSAL